MSSAPIRAFLVGTPRSGTTLLQSFFAAHPSVVTVPETHFFVTITSAAKPLRLLRLGPVAAVDDLSRTFAAAGERFDVAAPRQAAGCAPWRSLSAAFVSAMDSLARRHGARLWLEKTPRHLSRLDVIRRFVPSARVVHIIRDGADVAASMRRVTHESPAEWGGPRSLQECADRWRKDVILSIAARAVPGEVFVRYEDLVDDPKVVLQALCQELGLEYDRAMIRQRKAALKSVLSSDSPWNASLSDDVVARKKKVEGVESSDLAKIREELAAVDIRWCRRVVRS